MNTGNPQYPLYFIGVQQADHLKGEACPRIVAWCPHKAHPSVEALPRIIEYYQQNGYTFEAISRATSQFHHGVSN